MSSSPRVMLYVQPITQRHVTEGKTELLFHEDCDRRSLQNAGLSPPVPCPRRQHRRYSLLGKGKGKVHLRTDHEDPDGELRYSSTLFFNFGARWGGWSTPRSGRFTAGKETPYPLYRRLGGPQGRPGLMFTI